MTIVVGMDKVLRNLNKQIGKLDSQSRAGLFAGALLVERNAAKHVPVNTGNLRASKFTRWSPQKRDTIEIGFGAKYALWVHENLEQKLKGKPRKGKNALGVYWGPNGRPQFLTLALAEEAKNVLKTIKAFAKVKSK